MSVLTGKHIVITRASHQTAALETLLLQYQAIPILYPCIAIVPPADTTQLDAQLNNLEVYDWLVLTSTNTVHILVERLTVLKINPDWLQIKIAVVGKKTAQAFNHHFQIQPDFIPIIFTAESLAESIPINDHDRVFIPQSALADETLTEILTRRGADVTCIDAYETVIGEGGEDVPTMLQQGNIDAITFTSSSTVENFMRRINPLQCAEIPVVCIGSSTADTTKKVGFHHIIVPDNDFTLQGMLDALISYDESSLY